MRKMDEVTTEMMEHVCDNLCRYPRELGQEELEKKCAECMMGKFVCDILNTGNKNKPKAPVDTWESDIERKRHHLSRWACPD